MGRRTLAFALLAALLYAPHAQASAPLVLLPDAAISGEDGNDYAGYELSYAGDVNGDGLDDLLVGVEANTETLGWSNQGQAYLLFGRTAGWDALTSLVGADASFVGDASGVELGKSVAGVGDVDGDGLDDLLVSAPKASAGLVENGLVYLVLGRISGWGAETPAANADTSFAGESAGDFAGYSVAGVGDVNGDGYGDFAIGANGNDEVGTTAGQVYLLLGDPGLWPAQTDLGSADASFLGENAHDQVGYAVAGAGDVNGDGFDDIVLSALRNDEVASNAGKVYLVLGDASGWAMDTSLAAADASFLGLASEDEAGASVAGGGDVDGDGFDDLLLGAPDANEGGEDAGTAYLVLGSANGLLPGTALTSADAHYFGEAPGDRAGRRIAGGGDFDGDGLDDFAVSAPGNDEFLGNAGQAYVVLGQATSWPQGASLENTHASLPGVDVNAEVEGVALAGDLDGDGHDDLVIGAPGATGGAYQSGMIYVVFGFACGDADADGFDACGTPYDPPDCDDEDPTVHPYATETCNGSDDDCDGLADEGLDMDGDGQTPCAGDCDDAAADTFAGAYELCDGIDNDCDGDPAEDEFDDDGDGYLACEECNDADPTIYPAAPDICDDGIDSDCLGDLEATEVDNDGDGLSECAGDCDDDDAATHPNATELCNEGNDDDCNPVTSEFVDGDGDTFAICQGDCDDTDPAATPVGEEVCDGSDNDCNGLVDDEIDYDRDGWLGCGGEDCNDFNVDAHPGAPEIPYDNVDQNCDGIDLTDIDLDGFDGGPYGVDCHDSDPDIHPQAVEVCTDHIDNDCDGWIDQYDTDCEPLTEEEEPGCECRQGPARGAGPLLCAVVLAVLGLRRRRRPR